MGRECQICSKFTHEKVFENSVFCYISNSFMNSTWPIFYLVLIGSSFKDLSEKACMWHTLCGGFCDIFAQTWNIYCSLYKENNWWFQTLGTTSYFAACLFFSTKQIRDMHVLFFLLLQDNFLTNTFVSYIAQQVVFDIHVPFFLY